MRSGKTGFAALPYEEQIAEKQKYLTSLLGGFGRVEPVLAMEDPLHYRMKVHAVFGRDAKGRILCGEYKAGTHRIVEPEDSPIEDLVCRDIIRTVKKLVIEFRIRVYDEDLRSGFLRHVVVRRGWKSGEIMVVLVGTSFTFPSGKNFVRELLRRHSDITTVVLNVNARKTSIVLGDRERVLYGKGYILDELCGCTFRISAGSFFQVNPPQTEKLYRTALEYAALSEGETALDAYCGTGTIGIIAAKNSGGSVIGVEKNRDAVADAKVNAEKNGVRNISFVTADAAEYMERFAARNGRSGEKRIDVLFLDPPRSGADRRFLTAAAAAAPDRIVYISCGPESLARDLGILRGLGYRAAKIRPVDMFGYSEHVETIVLLQKLNSLL